MPSSAEVAEEKLAAAIKAVNHVLNRICQDPETAYLLGHGTESYELLCAAVAAYTGQPPDIVKSFYCPAGQPGARSIEYGTDGASYLTVREKFLAGALNIAPRIASEIIAWAEQLGRSLSLETREADAAFQGWCDSQLSPGGCR